LQTFSLPAVANTLALHLFLGCFFKPRLQKSEAKSRVAQPEKPSSPVPLASSTSAAAKTQQKTSSRSSALALCLEYVNQALGEVKNDVGLLEGLQDEAQLLLKHQTQQHTGASSVRKVDFLCCIRS
jgi:hypothetical protein